MNYSEACEQIDRKREETAIDKRKLIRNQQALDKKMEAFDGLCVAMYAEQRDVENLKKNTLGNLLKKAGGNYDKAYEKEYREYLAAKLKYDEMAAEIENLRDEIERQNSLIREDEREIDRLYEELMKNYPEARQVQEEFEEKKAECFREIKELKEAKDAVEKVLELAEKTKEAYQSAKGWATYDTFFNGGLLGDLVKYSKIDEAENRSNELKSASEQMRRELKDVEMFYNAGLNKIDSTTKAFDIWFDNIFTDFSVRNRLAENIDELDRYSDGLTKVWRELDGKLKEAQARAKEQGV